MRDIRRHHDRRIKAKTKRKMMAWKQTITPKRVGQEAAVHNTCSCWMCTEAPYENKRRAERDWGRYAAD
jgi:hypothetical protein